MINFIQKIEENPILLRIYRTVSSLIQLLPYYIVEGFYEDVVDLDFPLEMENSEFGLLTRDDMVFLGNHEESYLSTEELLRLLENGCLCFAVKYKGEIAAYSWCNLSHFQYKGKIVSLNQNEAYLFDARTYKPFRGKNLAPYLRHEFCKLLNKRGIERFISISLWSDSASIKFKKKLGHKPIQLFLYVCLLRKFHIHFRLRNMSTSNSSKRNSI